MQLNDINGAYSPSFFYMSLDAEGEILKVIKKYPSTFVHETLHYLQDLILPYNIRTNLSQLKWFLNIRDYAGKHGYIKRPFAKWDMDSETMQLQYHQSIGENSMKNQFVDKVTEIGEIEATFKRASGFDAGYSQKYREFDVYTYNLFVNGNDEPYHLGARDLLEYIAYKIEKKHYSTDAKLPQLPYETVDLLFDMYGLSFLPEDIRLCVAEYCLYNDNPIHCLFVKFLGNDEFKQNVLKYDYREVYKRLWNLEFYSKDNVKESIRHKTNRRLEQFANVLFEHYAYFHEIRRWILTVNDFAQNELYGKFVFSDMYHMKKEECSQFIRSAIERVGFPLVMNKKKKCISIQSEKIEAAQFVQFFTLQKFMAYVIGSRKETDCPICDLCRANFASYKEDCCLNPKRIAQNGEKCPYYMFLQSNNLLDIEII